SCRSGGAVGRPPRRPAPGPLATRRPRGRDAGPTDAAARGRTGGDVRGRGRAAGRAARRARGSPPRRGRRARRRGPRGRLDRRRARRRAGPGRPRAHRPAGRDRGGRRRGAPHRTPARRGLDREGWLNALLAARMMARPGEGRTRNDISTEGASADYGRKVGERLRAIRRQKKLSLQEVEATSNQEFKASVLGAYERGERAISVPRLQRLARFYSVPVDQLLPVDDGPDFGLSANGTIDLTDRPPRPPGAPVIIDLTKLSQLSGPEADMLNRYLTMIQVKRQDFNGRVLTIRRDDLQAIAAILGTGVEAAPARLDELGISYQPVLTN